MLNILFLLFAFLLSSSFLFLHALTGDERLAQWKKQCGIAEKASTESKKQKEQLESNTKGVETSRKEADKECPKLSQKRADLTKLEVERIGLAGAQADSDVGKLREELRMEVANLKKAEEGLKTKTLLYTVDEAHLDNPQKGAHPTWVEGKSPLLAKNYAPTFQWVGVVEKCLEDGLDCSLLSLPKQGCAFEGQPIKEIRSIPCPLGAVCTSSSGTPQIDLTQTRNKIAKISKRDEENQALQNLQTKMNTLGDKIDGLIKTCGGRLEKADAFANSATINAENLETLKVQYENAVAEAKKVSPQGCSAPPVDYSKEAQRLKKETEALLKTARGLMQSQKQETSDNSNTEGKNLKTE